jgi:hypothetical protein
MKILLSIIKNKRHYNLKKLLYLSLVVILVSSCEKVVDVDLEENRARLVINASLEQYKDAGNTMQSILLSKTTGFYNEAIVPVEDALIELTDANGNTFEFSHANSGIYINKILNLELNEEYQLKIKYKDEIYSGSEKMIPVTEIESVEQTETGGFAGDEIELKVFYQDPADEVNFYLFTFKNDKTKLEIYEDEFSNGNRIFGYYSNEEIEVSDTIQIEMSGISKAYYEYLFILRSQVGSGGGPFETQPATVKGNIVNETNKENYPFGYFQLSEVDSTSYIVK